MYRIHYVATITLDDYKDISFKEIKDNSKEFLTLDICNLIKSEFSENCKVDIVEHELDLRME